MLGLRRFIRATATARKFSSKRIPSSSATMLAPMAQGSSGNGDGSSYFGLGSHGFLYGIVGLLTATVLGGNEADCCGIVGVVGNDNTHGNASEYLLEGLTILRNRGYDSAGIASVSPDGKDLTITKYASEKTTSDSIDRVRNEIGIHKGHTLGIAHTRWATHGGKTDENAHPHTDAKNRIAVVHNGTINNSYDLKNMLKGEGFKFTSETDTEVIAMLIGRQLDKGDDLKNAVSHALAMCDGSWGLCVLHKSSAKEIVVACNGSPMTIGLAQGRTYIASETSAFSKYTKSFILIYFFIILAIILNRLND